MTKLQNSTNPTFGIEGQCWTSKGDNVIPDWNGYPAPFHNYPQHDQNNFWCTGVTNTITNSVANYTMIAGNIYYGIFMSCSTSMWSGMSIYVVTGDAGANVTFGVYEIDSLGMSPGALIAGTNSPNLSVAASGFSLNYTFASPITLLGGRVYYGALTCSSSAVVITGMALGGIAPLNQGATPPVLTGINDSASIYFEDGIPYSNTLPAMAALNNYIHSSEVSMPLIALTTI